MRLSRVLPYLIVVFSFCQFGCAPHDLKPISAKNQAEQLLAKNLSEPGFLDFVRANSGTIANPKINAWGIDRLTLAAFYFHPDMALVRAQNQVALANGIKAKELPNPTLSFTPEGITNPGAGISPWIQSFNLDFPIETAGKRRARIQQAASEKAADGFNLITVAWQVRSRLESAFFSVYLASKKNDLLNKQQRVIEDFLAVLHTRVQMGLYSPREITDFELTFDQTKIEAFEAKNSLSLARADLAAAIGLPVDAINNLSFDFSIFNKQPVLASNQKRVLQMRALTNRSDIRGGVADYASCIANLEHELAKRYPDINLGPGYQWSQGENHWSLGFSLSLPFLNFNRGSVALAKAQCLASMARFNKLQTEIISNLDHALLILASSLEREQLLRVKWRDEITRIEHIRGTGTSEEAVRRSVILAQMNQNSTELAYLDALAVTYNALFDLENILQRPLLGDSMIMKGIP